MHNCINMIALCLFFAKTIEWFGKMQWYHLAILFAQLRKESQFTFLLSGHSKIHWREKYGSMGAGPPYFYFCCSKSRCVNICFSNNVKFGNRQHSPIGWVGCPPDQPNELEPHSKLILKAERIPVT